MSVYDFKLHELQTMLNSFAIEEASKEGKKITFGIKRLAQGVGVDYATMKGFVYGTIKKPSERTLGRIYAYLQKMDDWVLDGSDDPVTELSIATPAEKYEARLREKASTKVAVAQLNKNAPKNNMLKTEMMVLHNRIADLEEDLEQTIKHKDKDREDLRLRYVEVIQKLDEVEAVDPDSADRYQTVHPDNSYWMRNADAFIKIYTWGPEVNYEMVDKKRVCTIPIPETSGRLRWHSNLPTQRREKKNGDVDWVVSDEWKMVQEDEFGQHWEKPEDDHSPIQTCLVESREQYESRQAIHRKKNVDTIIRIAKDIYEMYSDCGDWPDNEVGVDVLLANINNF